jgi:hypothetical protein
VAPWSSNSVSCRNLSQTTRLDAPPSRYTSRPWLEANLHGSDKRYTAMAARGKNKNQIVTAIGRELLGFIWAIAVQVEKEHQLAQAA